MSTPVSTNQIWRFGAYEVDTRKVEVRRDGQPVKMRHQPFLILVYLLERAGDIVTREELRRVLWPSDTFVDFDHSLSTAVMNLRDILGDSTESPLYIETIPKRGYRFIAPVVNVAYRVVFIEEEAKPLPDSRSLAEAPGIADANSASRLAPAAQAEVYLPPSVENGAEEAATAAKPANRRIRTVWRLLPVATLLAVGLAAMAWYLHRSLPPPRITGYKQLTHDGHEKVIGNTDGTRLYFTQKSPLSIRQIAIVGGESVPVTAAASLGEAWLWDVSPDGSNLLVAQLQVGEQPAELWNVRALGGSLRRLKPALVAAYSPDGSSVLYSTAENEIWTIRSDGTEAHKLIAVAGRVIYLAWSPDGRTIRFFKDNALWETSATGTNLHQLIPNWHASSLNCCGYWTPDGNFFLFQSKDTAHGSQIWAIDERRGLLRSPPVDPIQLTSGPTSWDWPIPSRDGKSIFADGKVALGELFRFDLPSKKLQPYLGGISAEFVSFSHDGKSIAYVTFPEGILWRANRDGTNPAQLTDALWYAENPRWSPNDAEILFHTSDANGFGFSYIVSAEGGTPKRLLPEPGEPEGDPTWSPDGGRIAYSAGAFFDQKRHHINILDRASGNVTTVPGSEGLWSPRWSPDGRYIAALSYVLHTLRVFDFKTRRWTAMPLIGDVNFPAWSHDSKFIYGLVFTGEDRWVFRVPISGQKPDLILDLKDWHLTGRMGFSMTLDPTDTPLVLREKGSTEIYALTLEEK